MDAQNRLSVLKAANALGLDDGTSLVVRCELGRLTVAQGSPQRRREAEALDLVVCWFILINGARRVGLLNLRFGGLDPEECRVRLEEKFGKVVHQPVPDWFFAELQAFALARWTRSSSSVWHPRLHLDHPPALQQTFSETGCRRCAHGLTRLR
jgi:hypothetical protein